jgi:hypothetical protein
LDSTLPTFSYEAAASRQLHHMGPLPHEDDTEGFLRYLDVFQAHAERLCVS